MNEVEMAELHEKQGLGLTEDQHLDFIKEKLSQKHETPPTVVIVYVDQINRQAILRTLEQLKRNKLSDKFLFITIEEAVALKLIDTSFDLTASPGRYPCSDSVLQNKHARTLGACGILRSERIPHLDRSGYDKYRKG